MMAIKDAFLKISFIGLIKRIDDGDIKDKDILLNLQFLGGTFLEEPEKIQFINKDVQDHYRGEFDKLISMIKEFGYFELMSPRVLFCLSILLDSSAFVDWLKLNKENDLGDLIDLLKRDKVYLIMEQHKKVSQGRLLEINRFLNKANFIKNLA